MAKKKSGDEPDEEAAAAAKKKKMMIGGGLVAAVAIYMFVLKPAPAEEVPDALAMAEVVLVEGEIIELPDLVINIADDNVSFARVGVALVLEEGTAAADFELETAIAKDAILDDLSGRTAEQLQTPEGKRVIKEELSVTIREAYGDAKVVRVLFTVFVMQ